MAAQKISKKSLFAEK